MERDRQGFERTAAGTPSKLIDRNEVRCVSTI